MKPFSKTIIALVLSFEAVYTIAADPPNPELQSPSMAQGSPLPSATVSDQLAQLQAQISLLKAQAEVAKLRREISSPSSPGGGPAPALPGAGERPLLSNPLSMANQSNNLPAPSLSPSPSKSSSSFSRPVVRWIAGYEDKMSAQLEIDNRTILVHEGSRFEPGYRVVSITPGEVVVERGKVKQSLRP